MIDGGLASGRAPGRRAARARALRRDRSPGDVGRCRAMAHARRLAEWVGPGRTLTSEGTLTRPDVAEAVRLLGLTRLSSDGDGQRAHDDLTACWDTALGARFLTTREGRVCVDHGLLLWRANSGDTRRRLWLRAFRRRAGVGGPPPGEPSDAVPDVGTARGDPASDPAEPADPEAPGHPGGVTPQGSAAMIALRLLYEAPDGLRVPDLIGTVGEVLAAIPGAAVAGADGEVAVPVPAQPDPVDGLVLLEDFDALTMPADRIALSPLGRYLGDSLLLPESWDGPVASD